jgi:ABC-type branched-subunit amino acid transport system permease subunit
VARFSNILEAIGAIILLLWGVISFPLGHPILGVVLVVLGLIIGWVTVREFRGHGLGRVPDGSTEDSKN